MNTKNKSIIRQHLCRSLAGLLILMAGNGALEAQSSQPFKIGMELDSHSVELGKTFPVNCVVLDADNKPVKAPKDFVVSIRAISASGQTNTVPVTVKAGESSCRLTLSATEAGITELLAKQNELQDGKAFIKIKSRGAAQKTVSMMNAPVPAPAAPAPDNRLRTEAFSATKSVVASAALATTAKHLKTTESRLPGAGLILKHESRKFLADGKDAATVTAFLSEEAPDSAADIQVIFHDSLGAMTPNPLVIQRGQDFGETKITSDHVGTATVEYITSNPKLNLLSEKVIEVDFGPPIARLAIQASPSKISLLESADISIQLLNSSGTPTATDEPRQVNLSFTGGGQLQSNCITIPANASFAHTRFYPTHLGTFKIEVSADNLLMQSVDISVFRPTALLFASSFGGLLGGLLAASVSQKRRKDRSGRVVRVLLGIVTGFAFYYFAILGFAAQIPGQVALNPFGAIFLAMVGGWLGTEVFTPICKVLIPKT